MWVVSPSFFLSPLSSLSLSQAEEVDEKAAGVLPSGLLAQLADANWKERLAACEKFQEVC